MDRHLFNCMAGHAGRPTRKVGLFEATRNRSASVLNVAERRKMHETKCCLGHGGNPFTKIQTLTLGGGEFDKQPEPERIMSPEQVRRLENKWQAGIEGKLTRHFHTPCEATNNMLVSLGLEPGPTSPVGASEAVKAGLLVCAFCSCPVENILATHGTGKPRKFVVEQAVVDPKDDSVTFETRVIHTADKYVACPKHAHLIKPITNKAGEIISQGVQFSSLED